MGNTAVRYLRDFALRHQIRFVTGARVRFIVSKHEKQEAKLAVQQLSRAGFDVGLAAAPPYVNACEILAMQSDQQFGAAVDAVELLQHLKSNRGCARLTGKVQSWWTNGDAVHVSLADGRVLQAEILVFACHLGARTLLPAMSEAFVPVAEQWVELRVANMPQAPVPLFFSANHGYQWGYWLGGNRLRVGGSRFLRKLAGIGWEQAPVDDRITEHLCEWVASTFAGCRVEAVLHTQTGLDCRPCDELPIIGPLFGENRVLLAGGYMGQGLSLGFLAGRAIADLITMGQTTIVPREIFPERLRSM